MCIRDRYVCMFFFLALAGLNLLSGAATLSLYRCTTYRTNDASVDEYSRVPLEIGT